MRLAFLGTDDDTVRLAADLRAAGHEVAQVAVDAWEGLLARTDLDAVVVARGGAELQREDQLRKLVGAGLTVVASHPAADVLVAYELEMIRREVQGTLLPYLPAANHPLWTQLRASDPAAGSRRLEQVLWERAVPDRRPEGVAVRVAQDLSHLRRLLGTITSVHAVGAARDDGSWSTLNVHLVADSGATATWSLAPPGAAHAARIHFLDDTGGRTLVVPSDDASGWQWEGKGGADESVPPWSPADELGAQLRAARAGLAPFDWNSACLDLEIADTVAKSLRKKRSIDLFTAGRTEERTFKGFMAAAGCLILVAILFVFLALALWDGFRSPFREAVSVSSSAEGAASRDEWPLWFRLWPVYPLFAFLVLQFLVYVARPGREPPQS